MSLVDVEAKLPLNLECFFRICLMLIFPVDVIGGHILLTGNLISLVSQLCFLRQEFPKGLLKMQKDVEISERFLNYGIRDMIT